MMENNLRLTNDLEAEKVLLDFKTYREDKERLIATCNEVIKEYKEKIEQFESELKTKEDFVKFSLASYVVYSQEPVKQQAKPTPKPQTKSALSDAQIKRLYTIAKIAKKTEEDVKKWIKVKWNKESTKDLTILEYDEICATLKLDWASYKKQLKQVDDKVIDNETGEVIEGVELKQKDGEFQIKY